MFRWWDGGKKIESEAIVFAALEDLHNTVFDRTAHRSERVQNWTEAGHVVPVDPDSFYRCGQN